MRRHFHRCGYLRVLELDVSELSHARKGGKQILEELCDAKHLAPCVGLAECDVLAAGQKRDLLAVRATRLREQEGGSSRLADAADPRAAELAELRRGLLDERNAIAEENRRRAAEAGGALRRHPRPLSLTEEHELAGAGISVVLDDDLRALRTARLDAIDRALDRLARGHFGDCARCGAAIEIERLSQAPDTAVCTRCARVALPEAQATSESLDLSGR
jgi:RNA polymerase-binding transcription factor DksA